MKKKNILLIFISIILSANIVVSKNITAFGKNEKIKKVADLPNTSNYAIESGKYMDLGIKYTVVEFFYIPVYQLGETDIVGYPNSDDNYIKLSSEEALTIALQNDLYLENFISIPFWYAWGGKIVLFSALLLLVYFFLIRNSKKINTLKKHYS